MLLGSVASMSVSKVFITELLALAQVYGEDTAYTRETLIHLHEVYPLGFTRKYSFVEVTNRQ
jgi:hypothetical protein